ncbi:PTS sugar transporter subunit IIA [Lachnoclostridium pacaense]|uniref:PTS sugar transporter subunit IIA n=1 Tax=Enterocloster hominis (ex Hitch et al. 2024) TaxID=1917870 RepID=UPI001D10665E|nr:PTS sugar transporter subunit IIA [Lachnoclostridium pacaense]MCC2816944.1 PTS sugar transporter subunit IIA [Lachnoclostridium pacaense]
MIWNELDSRLITVSMDVDSKDGIMENMGGRFVELGYCRSSYIQALKDREVEFPTGIDIDGVGVAMPHTDVSHVNRAGIGIATLKKPVAFVHMATDDTLVPVRVVFMLAVDDPQKHLEKIQDILAVIQDKKTLEIIMKAEKTEDIINIIKEKENGK